MSKQDFKLLLEKYDIDYFEDDGEFCVKIDDVNDLEEEFGKHQMEIVSILDMFPQLGYYVYYSEDE